MSDQAVRAAMREIIESGHPAGSGLRLQSLANEAADIARKLFGESRSPRIDSWTLAPKRRWFRYSLRTLFVVVIAGIAWGAWTAYRVVYVTVPNCYAVWWIGDMVTEFMATHNDAWPSCWDDLREPYETLTKRSGRPWTFDELQSRVNVDWDADPEILAEAVPSDKEPPFKVIWLRDGSAAYWSGKEPNRMVLDYLRSRQVQRALPALTPATD